MRHIFYVPASYAALIYALLAGSGLLLSLYTGLLKHPREILMTSCGPDHYEFCPSISTVIGDQMPERQIWRVFFVFCAPFRIGTSIAMFNVFWQKATGGVAELYSVLYSPRQLLRSTVFLVLLAFFFDTARLFGAVGWTMVASFESLSYHNLGFAPYIFFCFCMQITFNELVRRNRYNVNIYPVQRDAIISYRIKRILCWTESIAAIGVTGFYLRHYATCAPGSFSLSTMNEWVFAASNVAYDGFMWYELRTQGWWLSGSPSFYVRRWRTAIAKAHREVLPSALTNDESTQLRFTSDVAGVEHTPHRGNNNNNNNGSSAGIGAANEISVVDHTERPLMKDTAEAARVGATGYNGNGLVNGNNTDTHYVNVYVSPSAEEAGKPAYTSPSLCRVEDDLNGSELNDSEAMQDGIFGTDVTLHKFTVCCPPFSFSMWLCDIYWYYMYIEMVVDFVQHMYFMPMVAMSISWEMVSLLALASPCLLRFRAFRRWATGPCYGARSLFLPSTSSLSSSHRRLAPMYLFFYVIAALSHISMLVTEDPRRKILVSCVGPCFLGLALVSHKVYPAPCVVRSNEAQDAESSRRHIFTAPLAVLACMLMRILYISHSPVFVEAFYNAVFGLGMGLVCTVFIYRQLMFAPNDIPSTTTTSSNIASHHGGKSGEELDNAAAESGEDGEGVNYAEWGSSDNTNTNLNLKSGSTATVKGGAHGNSIAALATAVVPAPQWLLGILLALANNLVLHLYNSGNVLPRYFAIEPYPASLCVVVALALGIFYSADVVLIAPHWIAHSELRPSLLSRLLRRYLRHSWRRVGLLLAVSCLVMLYGTRQTNFTYEKHHAHYPTRMDSPKEHVRFEDWAVQENFAGNKYVAFGAALVVTFLVGAVAPVVMEITVVHQYHRRLARLANTASVQAIYNGEARFFASFELWWPVTTLLISLLYALCTSYPFVPMAWLVREKSRPLIFCNVMGYYLLAMLATRRHRALRPSGREANNGSTGAAQVNNNASNTVNGGSTTSALPSGASSVGPASGGAMGGSMSRGASVARRQHSLHGLSWIVLIFCILTVVIGRESFRVSDVSYPAGKTTAVRFAPQVAAVHAKLVEFAVERNNGTDNRMEWFERDYLNRRLDRAREEFERRVKHDTSFDLMQGLTFDERQEVWQAAEAMTFFTGMIWTVHFAFDNNNVDSFTRMLRQVQNTGAGVIGLLESDTMHLVNGNRDMVEYISYYNGFRYTDYGPTALDNTYGCALISRYPIKRIRRYVSPSPLGELSCLIHAELDIFGVTVQTYVGHFGNTEHWADGLLQSQFLGHLVTHNPGPSAWFGYLVTYPGNRERYGLYTSPTDPSKFRDTALELYVRRPWVWLKERGGYIEEPPSTVEPDPNVKVDFDMEKKLTYVGYLEGSFPTEAAFRRPPPGKDRRHFYYNETHRFATDHPRFEFLDRYCQYLLYKTGAEADELPEYAPALRQMPFTMDLFDWWRIVEGEVALLSDTEIQVMQLRFRLRQPAAGGKN